MNLLDTSALIWALATPERLSQSARRAIARSSILSVASFWEVVVKSGKGLLPIPDPVSWWDRASALFGGQVLPIRTSHVASLAMLPDLHRDPFDRILIAQAIAEGMSLVTSDKQIKQYSVRVIW